MQLLGLIIWAQMQVGFEGGAGLAHRIPVRRDAVWSGTFQNLGGEQRQPGLFALSGFALRYVYRPDRFIESGGAVRFHQVRIGGRVESFWTAMVPIRWGTQIDTSGWWVWGGLGSSLLLRARSQPDSSQVYRFADYFSRSQLLLQLGAERALSQRWAIGIQLTWEITSAWDRVLFHDSRSLPRHLMIAPYLRYMPWGWR